MQMRISPKEGIPIYRQIINQLKYMIASGRLSAGDKLPPVRKLAEQLLVNPNTVARAYRDLEALGLLITRQGSGVIVAKAGTPLTQEHQTEILAKHIDMLLTEAQQMKIGLPQIIDLLHERSKHLFAGEQS